MMLAPPRTNSVPALKNLPFASARDRVLLSRHCFEKDFRSLSGLAHGGGAFFDRALGQARQDPQVVRQHAPAHGQLPMGKAFAPERSADEIVQDDADPPFGLGTASLQTRELP